MHERAINFFDKVETKYPVSQWRIFGIDVWPFIRMRLAFRLITVSSSVSSQKRKENSLGKLPGLSSLLTKNEDIDAFILFDPVRRIKLGDSWYSRLSGPFNEELKRKGLHVVDLEYSNHNVERFPVLDESYSVSNQTESFKYHNIVHKPISLNKFEKVREEFLLEFGAYADFTTIEYVNDTALYIYKLSEIFETLFLKKKTKIALSVIYYHLQCYAFTLAAKRVGIPSVDIQHGKEGDPLYKQWHDIPSAGYNIMPDFFWCWDKIASGIITDWSRKIKGHRPINGGNPWIELWKDESEPLVKEYDCLTEQFINKEDINILVTLQPLHGTADWNENIPDWVMQAIDGSPDNWKWFIRYHPQMMGNFIHEMEMCEERLAQYIKTGKVETMRSTEEPLMAILRKMTIHITPFSTSVIEAQHSGVPSITIHKRGAFVFKNDIGTGRVLNVETTSELLKGIRKLINKKKEGLFPPIESDTLGLSKGLDIILSEQKDVRRYDSTVDVSLVQKKIYLCDGEFEKVISDYESEPKKIESFIAGRAYEKIGNTEKALECYAIYLNNLTLFYTQLELQTDDLLKVRDFYVALSLEVDIKKLDGIILEWMMKDEYYQNRFIRTFFNQGKHFLVVKWIDELKITLDTNFYVGRSLLQLGETEMGKKRLHDYLEMFDSGEFSGRTYQGNYKASAHFYLGKVYMNKNERKPAIYNFQKCDEIVNGEHLKALEYLEMLKGE